MIKQYLDEIKKEYESHIAKEHSYRTALKNLIQKLSPNVLAVNEPTRQKCGAPDIVILKKSVPLGYIECKDIDKDLDKVEETEQLKRYLSSLENLILTNQLEFRFFVNGKKVATIKVAELCNGKIQTFKQEYLNLENHIKNFCDFQGQTIKSPKQLASLMAQKAILLKDSLLLNLEQHPDGILANQLKVFKDTLLNDLDNNSFSDMYAQTIAYGLFVARFNDNTPENFSINEARDLVSDNNPFLAQFFDSLLGRSREKSFDWVINELVELFKRVDLRKLLSEFKKKYTDPYIHFYENFLEEFDKITKIDRGVFYTPQPVVKYIVNAVDTILKTEFNLPMGLADNSRINHNSYLYTDTSSKRAKKPKEIYQSKEIHRVQILDPATGTGTFLVEVIKKIYNDYFKDNKAIWKSYVDTELIPRLNGFEIMMTPYIICHLKLNMELLETGSNLANNNRFKVYLTNSLQKEIDRNTLPIFAQFLSDEANHASEIKNETPIMVVIGNPPYNVSSQNKNNFINDLIKVYKKDLNETKINMDDDYVKFIRLGESYIENNNEGILAYITNNNFLDAVTFRQMRQHLLKTFDKIFILNLHGFYLENCPDGSKDENVFDIKQGVCISIFVKTTRKKGNLAKVFYKDLYGLQEEKFEYLSNTFIDTTDFKEIAIKQPYYFFVQKDFSLQNRYKRGIKIDELFNTYNSGIETQKDRYGTIQLNKDDINKVVADFKNFSEIELRKNMLLKIAEIGN